MRLEIIQVHNYWLGKRLHDERMIMLKILKRRLDSRHLLLVLLLAILFIPLVVSGDSATSWALPTASNGVLGTSNGNGEITNTAQAIAFYEYFHVYLTPHWGLIALGIGELGGGIVQGVAHLVDGLQTVFYGTINLMGIFNDLSNSSTALGKFFLTTQRLGVIIFGISIVIYAAFVIFNGKSKVFRQILQTVVLTTLVVGFIPWMVGQSVTLTKDSIQETAQSAGEKSIALNLIQNNVVDKYALSALNWDVKLSADGTVSDPSKYNIIKSIDGWDAGELAGVVNDTTLVNLDKGISGTDASNLTIFEHQLVNEPKRASLGGQVETQANVNLIKYHDTVTASNYMEGNYLRYKVNWIPLILSLVSVGFLFVTMSIKVVLSIAQIVVTTIAAPVLAAIKAKHVKKVKELIAGIFHGIVGIFFDFLIVGIAVDIMTWLTTTTAFTDAGLPPLASSLLKTASFIGIFFGVFAGVGIVEKFLGVSSGHGNALKQIMSAALITRGVVGMARSGASLPSIFKDNAKGAKEWLNNRTQQPMQLMPQAQGAGNNQVIGNMGDPNLYTHNGQEWSDFQAQQNQNNSAQQGNSNRQKDAQKSLDKEQNTGKTPRSQSSGEPSFENSPISPETNRKTSTPDQKESPLEKKAPQTSENTSFNSPIEPEKTRREKAMERRAQRQQNSQASGANRTQQQSQSQPDLTKQAPQQNTPFSTQEAAQQNTPESMPNRVQQLEQKVDTMHQNKQKETEQQRRSAKKQERSQRLQKASQNLSQGFQTMQQVEPHIGTPEGDE